MSDDFWGGIFDFNGDGKTTWDEEMIGLAMIEDDIKRSKENVSSTPSYKIKEPKTVPMIKPVPEVVDDSNYRHIRNEYRTECVCAVIALIIMLVPAIVILWAVYSTYDPSNSASDLITIVFTVAGFVYGGVLIHTTGNSIKTSIENLETAKERYLKSKQK